MKNRRMILERVLACKNLKSLDRRTFLNAWKSMFFLFPCLHPDGFSEPDSGWPEELKPMAREAFRRAETGELGDAEIYPCVMAMEGLKKARHVEEKCEEAE